MKNRKSMVCLVAALVACSAVFSNAARKDEITLVMVPREDAPIQLGMDIANKYPTLLISYKLGVGGAVSLHGWTGTQWVNVSLEDFLGGKFFKKGPDSALVVEKTGIAVPGKILPLPDWCASASKITTTEMRPLLHLVGQYYDFSFKDWQWFAKRYNMDLDAINPEGLNVAWYHKRMAEHLVLRGEQGASDLRYWVSIHRPMVAEPVAPGETEPEKVDDAPLVEEEESTENPLTNEAPVAVIMSAADADEELSEKPATAAEPVVEEEIAVPAVEAAPEEKAEEKPETPAPADEPSAEETVPESSGVSTQEVKAVAEETTPENLEEM